MTTTAAAIGRGQRAECCVSTNATLITICRRRTGDTISTHPPCRNRHGDNSGRVCGEDFGATEYTIENSTTATASATSANKYSTSRPTAATSATARD